MKYESCVRSVCVFTDDDGVGGAYTVWLSRQVHLLDTCRYEDAALRESWGWAGVCDDMCDVYGAHYLYELGGWFLVPPNSYIFSYFVQ